LTDNTPSGHTPAFKNLTVSMEANMAKPPYKSFPKLDKNFPFFWRKEDAPPPSVRIGKRFDQPEHPEAQPHTQ
jgi:hypothetical protein